MHVVLDSWPILNMLEGRLPASAPLLDLFETRSATMSWINIGEVYYIVRRRRGTTTADEVIQRLTGVIVTETPSSERIIEAAAIKADYPLSYADAFAAATAVAHQAELWTGDPELLIPDAPWVWRDLRR